MPSPSCSSPLLHSVFPRHRIWLKPSISSYKCSSRLRLINYLNTDENYDTSSVSVEQLKKPPDIRVGDNDESNDEAHIRGIEVPRQRYIPIPKSQLLDALVLLFSSQHQKDQFTLFSSCLDSIIHAEHKSILEDMRLDYHPQPGHDSSKENDNNLKNNIYEEKTPGEEEKNINGYLEEEPSAFISNAFTSTLGLRNLLRSLPLNGDSSSSFKDSRDAVATRFQRTFLQLLSNAQFEELSARDLILTSALNSDYLLTLPIYVDWKKASESNAIIFRRGYATQRQKGLLIAEKLDYLQSKILQEFFFLICKPLGKFGIWISEAVKVGSQGQDPQNWIERVKLWLEELPFPQEWDSYRKKISEDSLENHQELDNGSNIWLAAQRAVTRYEGILSPIGPRGRLLRKFLIWIGLIEPMPKKPFDLQSKSMSSEPYLRPIFLSRMTLADIWEPATWKSCGKNIGKMFKTATSILFSQSVLQEPAFQELILLFTEERGKEETEDKAEFFPLQLKVYKKIPIPDLPVIFPHRKLSFRILDTIRLDIATVVGLLAFFINYKFENILSSPSAFLLDTITTSALIILVIRVGLGYKQTWDRYQLLVNKTLYEKTMASGFGSVHFLLDASEQQQYKEAILTYAILLKAETNQATYLNTVKEKCERFMFSIFKEKVDMPIDKAMETLKRLGLVTERIVDQKVSFEAIPCSQAYFILKKRWDSLLS